MNNLIKQVSPLFVGSAIALSTFSVQPVMGATLYNQIFIFGDSLSDAGNLFNLTGGTNPPPVFFDGRFSNGSVWSEYFAEDLGLAPELWIQDSGELITSIPRNGINFAFAGAKTDDTHITNNDQLFGLHQQVNSFIGLLGGNTLNNPQALGVLMAGANDYFGDPLLNPQTPVENLVKEIDRLSGAGLTNILVSNLPDLGKTPLALSFGEPVSAGLTNSIRLHNDLLKKELKKLNQANPETNLILFDFYSLFNDILDNPNKFGFINVTDSCIDLNLTPPNSISQDFCSEDLQDQFLFVDNQHPNTKAHRFIADKALQTVSTPEPTTILPLGFLGMGLLTNLISKRPSNKNKEKMTVAK
ncbi:lipolytic protein G-D-S-L family [Cyanobacterium stanieri PCC 7202]|uniref:Lipolytic protein G-D-S-L family n=1 Tax=Cyanobacterium stanieri (strain ATCC 29140 / PCC 7202) TaxID=292563 RepID=K9YLA3_CYASC|nr:lipolytic protein G-D-S-L family [Cyanobacterium stanieri PCC 7202]